MTKKIKFVLLYIIFIFGYINLSFELIILRQLINFVGSNVLVTSIIISLILLFLSLGYYIGYKYKFSHKNTHKKIQNYLSILTFYYIVISSYDFLKFYFSLFNIFYYNILSIFLFSLLFLSFPSILIGFIISVIGKIINKYNKKFIGPFMAIDTIGSVLGSLITTLIFMSFFGIQKTIIFLIFLIISPIILLISKKYKKNEKIFYISISLISIFFSIFISSKNNNYLIKDDLISRFEIIENSNYKLMKINNSLSSKISKNKKDMFLYINFINENFIDNIPKNKKYDILILGAGGFTIGLNDKINNYTFVDIEKDIKKISEEKFLFEPLTKNKEFIFKDAYTYILYNKKKYDIIIVDLYSNKYEIPENFVTIDFFYNLKKSLNKNGFIIFNFITSPLFNNDFSIKLDKTLRYVFKESLTRQIINKNFNPFEKKQITNNIYMYKNNELKNEIYTINKNSSFLDLKE